MRRAGLLTAAAWLCLGAAAAAAQGSEGMTATDEPVATDVTLGWVLLYVEDVEASLAFYERAFGLKRRFFHEEDGKAYGEMETGATRIGFASLAMAQEQVGQVIASDPGKPPLGIELALATSDVPALYARALDAGAIPVSEPKTKPWGQTVAYVRDHAGHLVEICTPMP